jgi:hypothetical protein
VARAKAEGVPVHCVGVGDPEEEHFIPLGRQEWLVHEGKYVTTRLKEAPLREIAGKTGGDLALPGQRPLALGEHYLGLVAGKPQRGDAAGLPAPRLRYAWLLLPAFVLLSLTLVLPERRGAVAPGRLL